MEAILTCHTAQAIRRMTGLGAIFNGVDFDVFAHAPPPGDEKDGEENKEQKEERKTRSRVMSCLFAPNDDTEIAFSLWRRFFLGTEKLKEKNRKKEHHLADGKEGVGGGGGGGGGEIAMGTWTFEMFPTNHCRLRHLELNRQKERFFECVQMLERFCSWH